MQNSEIPEITKKHHMTESEMNKAEKYSKKIIHLKIKKIFNSQSSEVLAALTSQFERKNLRSQNNQKSNLSYKEA